MRITLGRYRLRLCLDTVDVPLDYQYRHWRSGAGLWLRAWRLGPLSVLLSHRKGKNA